jgi:hypothetical protein
VHGYAAPVERKIRAWIVQQERSRRKQGQSHLTGARGQAPIEHAQPPVHLRPREQWL